jgi:UDP-glucose 4-epimerase
MAILVTGGAGYIGSATVELLRDRGEDVVVLDDLFRGHRGAIDPDVPLYIGKIGESGLVDRIVREYGVDSCIHFAALAYVGESVTEPARYFDNNVAQGLRLMEALSGAGVRRVVFSSTCATYGEPKIVPIPEEHPQWPESPYGWSKFFMERILENFDRAYGLKFVSLRYFNAAGATGRHGEHHEPETHLIPNVLAAAMGKAPCVQVFGRDYATPDGTAVRDYIHITDLAGAHILALDYLKQGGPSEFLNLGNGAGYSVLEVIETARRVTGRPIAIEFGPRREGDTTRLIAKADKARRVLGWRPQFPGLEAIIGSAWNWHQAHPRGYTD